MPWAAIHILAQYPPAASRHACLPRPGALRAYRPEKALARIKEQIPLGRLARPEEIARAVCFLAADESAYITGQVWAINGGLDM